jgi:hypothetical protein
MVSETFGGWKSLGRRSFDVAYLLAKVLPPLSGSLITITLTIATNITITTTTVTSMSSAGLNVRIYIHTS